MGPPQATCLYNFPYPIHYTRSYLQTLLHHQLGPHRLPCQMRILPIDPLHVSWTNVQEPPSPCEFVLTEVGTAGLGTTLHFKDPIFCGPLEFSGD